MQVKHLRVAVGDELLIGAQSVRIAGIDESYDEVALVDVIHRGQRRALWPKDSTRIEGVHMYAKVEPPQADVRGRIILTMVSPHGVYVQWRQGCC